MKAKKSGETGQAVLMVTLSLVMILGVLGLVVDIGWAYFRKEAAQAAAESAAMAAIRAAVVYSSGGTTCAQTQSLCQSSYTCPHPLPAPGSITNNLQNGCLYAQANGFTRTDGGRQNVVMSGGDNSTNPISGLTVTYWARATVTENIPQLFSVVLKNTQATVNAEATAGYFASASSGGCIYVLGNTGTDIAFSGTPTVQSGCGIYVNSTGPSAVLWSGSPTIHTTGGGTNIAATPSNACTPSGCSIISPAPNYQATPATDPFSSLQAPTPGSCADPGGSLVVTTTTSISQGTYCHQIIVSGTGITLTLNPGLYILENGISGGGSPTISGSGVTLYLKSGGITMSGTPTYILSAPSTGTYKGITLFEDKNDSSAVALSGTSSINSVTGVIYMPSATLTYSGGSGTSGRMAALVVRSVVFSGDTYINNGAMAAAGAGGNGGTMMIE